MLSFLTAGLTSLGDMFRFISLGIELVGTGWFCVGFEDEGAEAAGGLPVNKNGLEVSRLC